jgi:hypothetical protein
MKLNIRTYALTLLLLSFFSLTGNYSVASSVDLLAENTQVLNVDNHLPDLDYFYSTSENGELDFIEFIEDTEEEDDETEKSNRSVKKMLSSVTQYSDNSVDQYQSRCSAIVSFSSFFGGEKWYILLQVFRI